jgi:tetratricopeptide (TPR) repeat protein
MSSRPRLRFVALLLSLVPGWGHVYWGRERLGLTIFTAAAVAGFALLNGLFIFQGAGKSELTWTAGIIFALIFVATWLDLLARTSLSRVRREDESRERWLEEGTLAYLRNDLEEAVARFSCCLSLDPHDVEALFRLGVVAARRGDHRQARRWFAKTLRHDLEEKWQWEIQRELQRLQVAASERKAPPQRGKEKKKEEEAEPASAS